VCVTVLIAEVCFPMFRRCLTLANLLPKNFMPSTQHVCCLFTNGSKQRHKLTDMVSWRLVDENLNTRQVQWTLIFMCVVQILLFNAVCDATRPCSQSNPVNVRVATVFSESVVRARLLAVRNDSRNDTGLTVAQFQVSRVFKGPRSAHSTVFNADVLESDMQCIHINASCLVFVNMSTSLPHTGIRNDSTTPGRVSRLSPWSRKALKHVRLHICQSQYCSK